MFDSKYTAARMKELIAKTGTQADTARYLHVDDSQVSYIVTQRTAPAAKTVRRICRAFHVSANWFLGVEETGTAPCESRLFTDRLEAAHRQSGMTFKEIADGAGCGQQALTFYRRGKTEPGAVILCGLCEVLGVSADWMLGIDKEVSE